MLAEFAHTSWQGHDTIDRPWQNTARTRGDVRYAACESIPAHNAQRGNMNRPRGPDRDQNQKATRPRSRKRNREIATIAATSTRHGMPSNVNSASWAGRNRLRKTAYAVASRQLATPILIAPARRHIPHARDRTCATGQSAGCVKDPVATIATGPKPSSGHNGTKTIATQCVAAGRCIEPADLGKNDTEPASLDHLAEQHRPLKGGQHPGPARHSSAEGQHPAMAQGPSNGKSGKQYPPAASIANPNQPNRNCAPPLGPTSSPSGARKKAATERLAPSPKVCAQLTGRRSPCTRQMRTSANKLSPCRRYKRSVRHDQSTNQVKSCINVANTIAQELLWLENEIEDHFVAHGFNWPRYATRPRSMPST